MKKYVCLALALLMIAGSLCTFTACGNKSGDSDNELVVWAGGQWVGTDLQNLMNFVDYYNETNTLGLTVKVVPKSDMESALATAVRNNQVPDLLIWDRFNTPAYAESNALLDISEYIERDSVDTSLFNTEAMNELVYKGKTYGLPLDVDVWGIYVNMDMVDAYNAEHADDPIVLNDNWTWDEMYEIAKKLTVVENGNMKVAGYSGHVMHQHLFKYMVSQSQSFLNEDGSLNLDTPEVRDILSFFEKIGKKNNGIWENGLCEKSNFTAEQLAMIDQSLYFTDYIERYNPTMNYKFMPQPRYSVDGEVQEGAVNGGMLGGFGIAFPKPHDRYINDEFWASFEKAWAFAKDWLLNESMQARWSSTTGTLPALNSLLDNEDVLTNDTLKRAAVFVGDYKTRPQIPAFLTMQTQVIDTQIKAFTEGQASLEQTISNLMNGCKAYIQ